MFAECDIYKKDYIIYMTIYTIYIKNFFLTLIFQSVCMGSCVVSLPF